LDEFSRFDLLKCLRTGGEVLTEIGKTIRMGTNHNDRDFAPRKILLVSEIGVQSDQGIERIFGQLEKLAIFFACPTRFLSGPALVPMLS
jgi:hypothetical protein